MSISGGSNRILLDLNVHKVLATVSQELWTSGGALFQRAQEPNIPRGESLTSTFLGAHRLERSQQAPERVDVISQKNMISMDAPHFK